MLVTVEAKIPRVRSHAAAIVARHVDAGTERIALNAFEGEHRSVDGIQLVVSESKLIGAKGARG